MEEPTSSSPSLPFHLDSNVLVASWFWGAIAAGFIVYGKKQHSWPAMFGGIAMCGTTYFIDSAIWMSVASVGIIVGIYFWSRYT
jgi:hypothetical protein